MMKTVGMTETRGNWNKYTGCFMERRKIKAMCEWGRLGGPECSLELENNPQCWKRARHKPKEPGQ